MDLRDQMNKIYRDTPVEQIPWNLEQAPELLAEVIQAQGIEPCDAVDIGCGAGNYAIWLAMRGFRMTGVDFSSAALELARKLAGQKRVECRFLEMDITQDQIVPADQFDFGYDWELLHHIFPERRNALVTNLHRMLRPEATYLSVCFSDRDPDFGGKGKIRETPLGTKLYFSSEEEIEQMLIPKFEILDLGTRQIAGKYGPHRVVVALMKPRALNIE